MHSIVPKLECNPVVVVPTVQGTVHSVPVVRNFDSDKSIHRHLMERPKLPLLVVLVRQLFPDNMLTKVFESSKTNLNKFLCSCNLLLIATNGKVLPVRVILGRGFVNLNEGARFFFDLIDCFS